MRECCLVLAFWVWSLGGLAVAQTVGLPPYPDAPNVAGLAPAAYPPAYAASPAARPQPDGAPAAVYPSPYSGSSSPALQTVNPPIAPAPPYSWPNNGAAPAVGSEPAIAAAPAAPAVEMAPAFTENRFGFLWYAEVGYFHWGEPGVSESGTLVTVGCEAFRPVAPLRVECFFGNGNCNCTTSNSWTASPLSCLTPGSTETSYLGFGLEWEFRIMHDVLPSWFSLYAGVGSRLWARDLAGGPYNANFGDSIPAYADTWWTFYPYVAVNVRRPLGNEFEWYVSARVGCTVFTDASLSFCDTDWYPKPGVTERIELGIHYHWFNLAGYFDGMSWGQSGTDSSGSFYQSATQFYQLGLKLGCSY